MIRDTFPRTRWGSVGLDCADCSHFAGPPGWPDAERASRCSLHDLSLAAELDARGFKVDEWFCRDFDAAGHTIAQGPLARLAGLAPTPSVSPDALAKLDEIRSELRSGVLYGFSGEGRNLKEIPFSEMAGGER
jgi:hypothetical protein